MGNFYCDCAFGYSPKGSDKEGEDCVRGKTQELSSDLPFSGLLDHFQKKSGSGTRFPRLFPWKVADVAGRQRRQTNPTEVMIFILAAKAY
jgi:hypothetical protein